jgi:hypothetical protein
MPHEDFDFSDVTACDGVSEILDVAISVLQDYGDVPGESRLERLARGVVYNLSGSVELTHEIAGRVSETTLDDGGVTRRVQQAGGLIGIAARTMRAEQARQLAAALLICANRADASDD